MKTRVKKIISVLLVCVMLCGGTALCAAADSVKRISCVMYDNGATGRGFGWYTAENSASNLQIVPADEFTGGFENAAAYSGTTAKYRSQYFHKVVVTDLEPGTQYKYRVGDAEKGLWSDCASFETDDADGAFKFITIADVQASSKENFEHAAKTLKAALDICPAAEFTVNLGDYVNDNTNEEWDWYFESFAFANNTLTHVPVAGNHDGNITNKFNTNCFKNIFPVDVSDNQSIEGVYYSFDYGNAHFAVLNTNDMYPMSQAQRNWLINDMTNSDAQWKIILTHRALYSAGKNINKPDTVIMRNVLLPIIDELDIDMVFSGHDHMYLRTTQVYADAAVQGTEYVTEYYGGEETTFALNPEGTVYALPSTAGTKRYSVNEDAMPPILNLADKALSTKELGGCFALVEIDGDRLVYKAFAVDDETQETQLIDSYAIKKTEKQSAEGTQLDQSFAATAFSMLPNFFAAIFKMMISYFKMLLGGVGC